jgi:hypothetical protein
MSGVPIHNSSTQCIGCGFTIMAWVKYDHIGGDEYIVNDWGWSHKAPKEFDHEAEPNPNATMTYMIETESLGLYKATEERWRQINKHGYTAGHDDSDEPALLARAGACYADWAAETIEGTHDENEPSHPFWPWEIDDWKPRDPKRALEKAMALLAAEYDKLVRDESA